MPGACQQVSHSKHQGPQLGQGDSIEAKCPCSRGAGNRVCEPVCDSGDQETPEEPPARRQQQELRGPAVLEMLRRAGVSEVTNGADQAGGDADTPSRNCGIFPGASVRTLQHETGKLHRSQSHGVLMLVPGSGSPAGFQEEEIEHAREGGRSCSSVNGTRGSWSGGRQASSKAKALTRLCP